MLEKNKAKDGKKGRKSKVNYSSIHWNIAEHSRYVAFLAKNKELFLLPFPERKKIKIHQIMSNYIKVRTSLQCRTHHQKMLRAYNDIDGIL